MMDSIAQTFIFLAYSAVAFIAVAIANYAVSASFLGRETRLSISRMETKRHEVMQRLAELQKGEPQIADIKKEINQSEKEQSRLSARLFLLSWLGGVVLPSMFFIFCLAFALLGLNSETLNVNAVSLQQQTMIFSFGALGLGLMILLFVIRAVDSAARKIPVPEFGVSFQSDLKSMKFRAKEGAVVRFCIGNKGEDIAENVAIFLCFPPEFMVEPNLLAGYYVYKQSPMTSTPNYNAAISKVEVMHIGGIIEIDVRLTMPDRQGTYEIPIHIYERKKGLSKYKLFIDVS